MRALPSRCAPAVPLPYCVARIEIAPGRTATDPEAVVRVDRSFHWVSAAADPATRSTWGPCTPATSFAAARASQWSDSDDLRSYQWPGMRPGLYDPAAIRARSQPCPGPRSVRVWRPQFRRVQCDSHATSPDGQCVRETESRRWLDNAPGRRFDTFARPDCD